MRVTLPCPRMAGGKGNKVTPLMRQFAAMKAQHPDAILLFRVGDFYETFGDDAERAAGVLGITLTSRNNGGSDVALAGFPYHSLDAYLPKLVRAGFRVAICEQLEKPTKDKKVVDRGITDLYTPGIAHGDHLLESKRNTFLAAVAPDPRGGFGIAFVDVSTGEFLVAAGDQAYVDKLLQGFQPAEVVLPKGHRQSWTQTYGDAYYAYPLEDWIFEAAYGRGKLIEHFRTASLRGFAMEDEPALQAVAGALLHYLQQARQHELAHLSSIRRILPDQYVWLDRFTVRNLELLSASSPGGRALVDVLDATTTAMGARLLRRWVLLPLTSASRIEARHAAVAALLDDDGLAEAIVADLKAVGDLERLIGKTATQRITPRELRQLLRGLATVPPLLGRLSGHGPLHALMRKADPCTELARRIAREICAEAPTQVGKGDVIAEGVDADLDRWRSDVANAQALLNDLREREARATGITSLKVSFNNVFGYYFEVTNRFRDDGRIPAGWTRKQTLANAERYISAELKDLEDRILGAGERILAREEELFRALVADAVAFVPRLQTTAQLLARLDVLCGFAHLARQHAWTRPRLDDSRSLELGAARHPVIEATLRPGESFVPNDIALDPDSRQVLLITGPNMSGKSAILRQTAIAVLMAQMGSYVAAQTARIGIVDKVFTRVGASDNLSGGESTFMVEMNETASIMNNVSARSLVLLDEIGRGTSTFDGVSIAWAIAEFLHEREEHRPKTLFATHYHELNALAQRLPRVFNMHVATQEIGDRVVFLRKLVPGGSRHSFGIHVARLAGMPTAIVVRAGEILAQLETQRVEQGIGTTDGVDQEAPKHGIERGGTTDLGRGDEGNERSQAASASPSVVHLQPHAITRPMQLSIFEAGDPIAAKLRAALEDLDVENLTPVQAMTVLLDWRRTLAESR